MKQTKEIKITKELNGLTYILSGELVVDYWPSPYKEDNPAYQLEEVDRYIKMPWLQVAVGEDMILMWDRSPHRIQLKFFETEINEIEI